MSSKWIMMKYDYERSDHNDTENFWDEVFHDVHGYI